MFSRKKVSEEDAEEDEEKRIEQIISREYKMFREQERLSRLPRTLYEKFCRGCGKIIHIEPDPASKKKMQEAIDFSHLRVTPNDVASSTILVVFIISFAAVMGLLLNIITSTDVLTSSDLAKKCLPYTTGAETCTIAGFGLDLGQVLFIIMISIPLALYMYRYPFHLKKRYEMDAGSEIVIMILYMAIYLRNTPNMEKATEFASKNLSGPLGFELRKLMWDVEVGNFLTVEDALTDYARKWSSNKELVEALDLMITSLKQTEKRRELLLDEAINRVLEGSREDAKHYVQKLKMPIAVIHAMGIILPVMGLVMFPIIAIFLNVSSIMLFIVYDVALPLILFFVIGHALEERPATYSRIDISDNPDMPPPGRFKMGKISLPAWPFAVVIAIVLIVFGVMLYGPEQNRQILSAMLITSGVAFGPAVYFILIGTQRIELRNKTQEIEKEFREALFQFGNTVAGGTPIELAMEDSTKRMEALKIKDLFLHASQNIRRFGLTFEAAFFDERYGAIKQYPSRLVKSVMRTVVESAKKGVKTASMAMLSISRYLKGLHKTQEQVNGSLSEVTGSLKFQAYFLSPFIAGIISTLAIIIIQILQRLGEQTAALGVGAGGAGLGLFGAMSAGNMGITPFEFILVVSIYMIESCFLLGLLMNGIEQGEDPTGRQYLTGWILVTGFIVYAVSVAVSLIVFGPITTGIV